MLDPDKLFLDVLSELRERRSTGRSYDLLVASGRLRLLLLDGNCLLDTVNRERRLQVRFETIDFNLKPPVPIGRIMLHWQTLDVAGLPGARRISVNRQQLLQAGLLTYKGREFTVRDLIKTAAIKWGGVHHGEPVTDIERSLSEMQEDMAGGRMVEMLESVLRELGAQIDFPDAIRALDGVISVVLRGLEPIEQAVSASR